ncbi:PPOX class F420-dependent oxidoreductase [Streptomyces abyssomicinicus]|uniref:PPOX class F420-dependent oxidoreductase n=1 Tax=Streptomyces abyssomicinicus TaxID=574929 RepID=UPI00124FB08A|nr:PPOX class F420-dependent oxidoreductase [Streptomyces abyssomicinicus]
MSTLDALATAPYVSVTTFRKDGRAVATPVWVVPDGEGTLAVWTRVDSGKVKRIRRDGRVTVAPCDFRGNLKGEAVEARARLGTPEDVARVRRGIIRKYGLSGRLTLLGSRLRGGHTSTVAVLITPAD